MKFTKTKIIGSRININFSYREIIDKCVELCLKMRNVGLFIIYMGRYNGIRFNPTVKLRCEKNLYDGR